MIPPLSRLSAAVARRVGGLRDTIALRRAFRHLHGPKTVILGPDQVALVALVKDAAWFIGPFLDHHRALGVTHVVLVDNGSADDTLAIAARYPGVTILQNPLPAKRHEVALRVMGARRVVRGGWFLFADADEMAELPFGNLPDWTRYGNDQGFTAFLGQMIDLYAPGPYRDMAALDYPAAIEACNRWSARGMERAGYHDAARVAFHWFLRDNVCDDAGVGFLTGGLRAEVFGETPFLTKHSLVRNLPAIAPMTHPHAASGVTVADVTLALRHYKLAGPWRARDRASVAAATWDHSEDARRLLAAGDDSFAIAPAEPLEWRGAADLLARGVLYASERARGVLGG